MPNPKIPRSLGELISSKKEESADDKKKRETEARKKRMVQQAVLGSSYRGAFSKQGASDSVKAEAADPQKKNDPNTLVREFQRKQK